MVYHLLNKPSQEDLKTTALVTSVAGAFMVVAGFVFQPAVSAAVSHFFKDKEIAKTDNLPVQTP